jgi:hypothetical protein
MQSGDTFLYTKHTCLENKKVPAFILITNLYAAPATCQTNGKEESIAKRKWNANKYTSARSKGKITLGRCFHLAEVTSSLPP